MRPERHPFERRRASQGVPRAAAASSLAGDTSPGRGGAPCHNSLAEARRRLLAGWTQSVAGGWPDIPPLGMLASLDAPPSPPANRNVHEVRFLEALTATLVAAAIFALIGLIYLSITGG